MGMLEWAKKECEIAKKRERGDKPENEWDYGCACYDSAIKAFESLCEDEHSGMSIKFTQGILNRLIDGKPLTPIEDTDDIWGSEELIRGEKHYQCLRMSSLFKWVSEDGSVRYSDVNRYLMHNVQSDTHWSCGMVNHIGEERYPITMPYMPESKPYIFDVEEYLTDRRNGDYDTLSILRVKLPDGSIDRIDRYFREPKEGETPTFWGWVEIGLEELWKRKALHDQRIKEEAKNAGSN